MTAIVWHKDVQTDAVGANTDVGVTWRLDLDKVTMQPQGGIYL